MVHAHFVGLQYHRRCLHDVYRRPLDFGAEKDKNVDDPGRDWRGRCSSSGLITTHSERSGGPGRSGASIWPGYGDQSNAVADSYLYTQNAATIKKLVQITTVKYRTDFASKVRGHDEVTYPIASTGAAYHHMREYLALCLPPTIQSQIEERLAGAKAVTVGTTIASSSTGGSSMLASRRGGSSRGVPVTAVTLD